MILSTTAFFNLRPMNRPYDHTVSPIDFRGDGILVSAVTLVMELRIDSAMS